MIEPYGICSHINRKGDNWEYDTRTKDASMMKVVGANYYRTDWDWYNMPENNDGNIVFSHFDSMINTTDSLKLKVLGIVTVKGDYKASEIESWNNFVAQEAKHFKQVFHWEILNEVDIIRKWAPNIYVKEYIELLKRSYQTIKISNRNAKVLLSGLANVESDFTDSVLSAGVHNYFDIMNVHRYNQKKDEPESLIYFYKRLKLKLSKYNVNKPVWLTECGCTTAKGWGTEETQAYRLPRIFLISFACGIDKVFWYKSRSNELDEEDRECFFGLWHQDYSPKPAFYAYQTLTKMCPNKSSRPILKRIGNIYIASWKRPDNKKIWALWTSKREETINVDISGKYEAYNITGKAISINPLSFEVSPSVVYIVGSRKLKIDYSLSR